jgi:hypothetical protein
MYYRSVLLTAPAPLAASAQPLTEDVRAPQNRPVEIILT